MDIIVIYCTVPDKQIAKDITNILLKHKLAACVSMIDKVRSKFSWDGEICEEKEILMMIKTRRTNKTCDRRYSSVYSTGNNCVTYS